MAERMNRRAFIRAAGAGAGALLVACTSDPAAVRGPGSERFGALRSDPEATLDLPRGFRYKILQQPDDTLSDGAALPGRPDGMGAFEADDGATLLIRNHELEPGDGPAVEGTNPFDPGAPGGTTALLVSSEREAIESYVCSSGTDSNCAGGATPWDTWLTCEETTNEGHGYVFEVTPGAPEDDLSKTPIEGMGRFSHEAAAVDPETGVVYLTEDDSPVSFLYRYIPDDTSGRPGSLHSGGRLQALGIEEEEDPEGFAAGDRFAERWLDVDPTDANSSAQDVGGVRFRRLEGADFAEGVLWFNDTEGGDLRLGRTYRYTPGSQSLELFFESDEESEMKNPDNSIVAPWGDLLFVEDARSGNRMMGVSPQGEAYELALNRLNGSELAGPCFSPDGRTLFVNFQDPGITFALWGPFPEASAERRRLLAAAPPGRQPSIPVRRDRGH